MVLTQGTSPPFGQSIEQMPTSSSRRSNFLGFGYEDTLEMFVMDKCSQKCAQDLNFEHSGARMEQSTCSVDTLIKSIVRFLLLEIF